MVQTDIFSYEPGILQLGKIGDLNSIGVISKYYTQHALHIIHITVLDLSLEIKKAPP